MKCGDNIKDDEMFHQPLKIFFTTSDNFYFKKKLKFIKTIRMCGNTFFYNCPLLDWQ